MQFRKLMRTTLVLSIFAHAAAFSASAEGQAWLRLHENPSTDELAELKTENPEAYGIVKALLTKRSLGLLDPKHPSASFSAKPVALDADARGPDAFAKFASTPTVAIDQSAASVEPPTIHKHRDFFNWKPPQSGLDDDQEVKNVIGAVTAVVQDKPAASAGVEKVVETKAVNTPPPVAVEENSYLKGLDLGDKPLAETPKAAPEDNRYLRGSGLDADERVRTTSQDETGAKAPQEDLLATFSWNDEPTPKPHRKSSFAVAHSRIASNTAMDSAASAQAKAKPSSNLFAWLNGKSAPAKQVAKAVATTVKPSNPYMMDLD